MYHTNERSLIQDLKKGNEAAYIHLVDLYNHRLFGYAISLTNDSAMAEDILQNVFLRTWEKRKKLHITSSLQNYLFRSVHNEFINQYKKQRTNLNIEQKYFESLEKIALIQDENRLERAITIITKEIQNLPPKCREIFMLSRKEGLTNLEISNYLDVSVKTVESHITKAFRLLRKKLGDNYHTLLFLLLQGHVIEKKRV